MPDPGASSGLVLDTSPWINLLATEMIEPILNQLRALQDETTMRLGQLFRSRGGKGDAKHGGRSRRSEVRSQTIAMQNIAWY